MSNISNALSQQACTRPNAVALIIPKKKTASGWQDERLTYAELNEQVEALARGLVVKSIPKGTRVALMVPPSPMFFIAFFALMRAGCVPILIDPGIGLKPLKKCLGEAAPQIFMGIAKAQWARRFFGWGKTTVEQTITVGARWGQATDRGLMALGRVHKDTAALPTVDAYDPAAILFTSGSTGIPKGVVYRHGHFQAQVELIRDTYSIESGEVDCPTFPPFALFDPALGMTTVIPQMDFTKPAQVDPEMLVGLIQHYGVTNLFGSPALMNTLTRYTQQNEIKLPSLRRVLSAGAPVSPQVVERMHRALSTSADIHTPYGATEALPVATVSGRQILSGLSARHRNGLGICVGKCLSANEVKIIEITDAVIEKFEHARQLPIEAIGEICVHGPSVTEKYWSRPQQTALAKMTDGSNGIWHRMGDVGWLDEDGRLWFCGRKNERVITDSCVLYTECVEGIVNAIPGVYRSALIGLPRKDDLSNELQEPVIVIELDSHADQDVVLQEVQETLKLRPWTAQISKVQFRKKLPVDIRHNAKIGRAQLARELAE